MTSPKVNGMQSYIKSSLYKMKDILTSKCGSKEMAAIMLILINLIIV